MSYPSIPTSAPAQLDLDTVVCAFGRTIVVDCVDLHLAPGEHVALIGSNGSGKSTLLRAIWGLHPLASGRIVCDEREATTPTAWYIRCKRIAWMPQRQATGQFLLLVRELLANSGHQEMAYAALPQAMSTERPTRHSHQNTSNHPNLV